jgi:hypothetical protein
VSTTCCRKLEPNLKTVTSRLCHHLARHGSKLPCRIRSLKSIRYGACCTLHRRPTLTLVTAFPVSSRWKEQDIRTHYDNMYCSLVVFITPIAAGFASTLASTGSIFARLTPPSGPSPFCFSPCAGSGTCECGAPLFRDGAPCC